MFNEDATFLSQLQKQKIIWAQ